ncbi:aminotransferase class V-fold PLP-dependent enzyme [Lysobacter sp. N42]|uniref:aminotransferase class V-fold PLP-dependent enzyme n=2 Tax=Gammaproteobacteria TaxID=1236 RepID=UPI001A9F8C03|nr:aminotransferase class V-fold PLP-dependent enzyme [Lysobacter sp. N42]
MADDKWGYLFAEKVPAVQEKIANILNVSKPAQIVFAPNTHELLYRALSSFRYGRDLAILTTDSEFHSFNRQSRRLEERGNVEVVRVPTEPFDTFAERWRTEVASRSWDMIFISQIFFNSGVAAPAPSEWLDDVQNDDTLIMVDGYHGFGAIPTDWQPYEERLFYLAGGYKYAQAGEGCCFAVVPSAHAYRPEYTGWYADFGNLTNAQEGQVGYADDGMAFAGATMDLSALYRLDAVLTMWQQEGLKPAKINEYVSTLKASFLKRLDELNDPRVNRDTLLENGLETHGHFFTFRWGSAEDVATLAAHLREQGVLTDYRDNRLRFGFGLYHETQDYQQLNFNSVASD